MSLKSFLAQILSPTYLLLWSLFLLTHCHQQAARCYWCHWNWSTSWLSFQFCLKIENGPLFSDFFYQRKKDHYSRSFNWQDLLYHQVVRNEPLRCNLGHKPHVEPCFLRPWAPNSPGTSRFWKEKFSKKIWSKTYLLQKVGGAKKNCATSALFSKAISVQAHTHHFF